MKCMYLGRVKRRYMEQLSPKVDVYMTAVEMMSVTVFTRAAEPIPRETERELTQSSWN